jgi:hypothetical protein
MSFAFGCPDSRVVHEFHGVSRPASRRVFESSVKRSTWGSKYLLKVLGDRLNSTLVMGLIIIILQDIFAAFEGGGHAPNNPNKKFSSVPATGRQGQKFAALVEKSIASRVGRRPLR